MRVYNRGNLSLIYSMLSATDFRHSQCTRGLKIFFYKAISSLGSSTFFYFVIKSEWLLWILSYLCQFVTISILKFYMVSKGRAYVN